MWLTVETAGAIVNPSGVGSGLAGFAERISSPLQDVDRDCGPFYGPHNLAGGRIVRAAPRIFSARRWMDCHEDQEFAASAPQSPSQQPRGQAPWAALRHQQDQPPLQGPPGLKLRCARARASV